MYRDVIVRSRNTTEENIEEALVSEFGRKLTPDEMKKVTAVKIAQPDISLIRGNQRCPQHAHHGHHGHHERMDMPQERLKLQSPGSYFD
jgi:hypothetical protein